MLPTQELFRSIPCPYYVAGLCERPHCFFRHTKSDILLARKVEQGLLLENGSFSDDEDEGSHSKCPGKSVEKLNSISDKISAASTNSKTSIVNSSDLKPNPTHQLGAYKPKDELRKRPALDGLEGMTKKIRLSLDNQAKEIHTENDKNISSGAKPKLIGEVSQVYPKTVIDGIASSTEPLSNNNCIVSAIDTTNQLQLRSKLGETVIEVKSNSKETTSRNQSSPSSHSSNNGNNNTHEKKSRSSSSSSSKSSSKHSTHSNKLSSSKKNENKSSSSNSSKSKERSHTKSSSSHRSSSKTSSSHKKVSSSSKSNSNNVKNEKRDLEENNKCSKSTSSTRCIDKKTDKSKLEVDMEILDDVEYSYLCGNSDDFRFPEVSDYEDDPDDIAMECLKMFEDYKPTEENHGISVDTKSAFPLKLEESAMNPSHNSRRRMAHPGAGNGNQALISPQPPTQPNLGSNLMKTVGNRLEAQRNININHGRQGQDSSGTGSASTISALNKKRIAHVPNVSGLLRPNSGPSLNSVEGLYPQLRSKPPFSALTAVETNKPVSTTAQTATKGKPRLAHLPSEIEKKIKRPMILVDSPNRACKIPNSVRQKCLDQMFDVYVKLLGNNQESAFQKSVSEENSIVTRSSSKPVYLSLSVTAITRLRREMQTLQVDQKNTRQAHVAGIANQIVSHNKNLCGASSANCSILKISRDHKFPEGIDLYKGLQRYILSEAQLRDNGYPRPHPSGEAGRAVALSRYKNDSYVYDATHRTCERCEKVYTVNIDGSQVTFEECTYHSGRKNRKKFGKTWLTKYTCCGDEIGASGCITLSYHIPRSLQVSKSRGFLKSVHDAGDESIMGSGDWDIVAVDCEMVCTTAGTELARATFIGKNNKIIFDKLVKPDHPVLDYMTQYSGITEEMMKGADVTLAMVQAAILTELKPNSILIGHSLESDLLALRIQHDCVIDTSVLYPHRMGAPYKRALRNLMSDVLSTIIQNSEAGHDSAEDARAALSLVYHKLREDIKLKECAPNGN